MVSGYCCPNITTIFFGGELACLADWNCEASLLVAYEAVDRVGCVVVVAVFPGSEVSARLLVLEEKILDGIATLRLYSMQQFGSCC